MDKRPHLEPGRCPGADYFKRRDEEHKEELREIVTDALGDVPKYMKMAGDNRVWLWAVSGFVVLLSIIVLIV